MAIVRMLGDPVPLKKKHKGYIAGTGLGIVTVAGKPASRVVHLFARGYGSQPLELVGICVSKPDGSYRFDGLDVSRKYLVMASDHEMAYEPVGWDWITPAVEE